LFGQSTKSRRPLLHVDDWVVAVNAKDPRARIHDLVISREHISQREVWRLPSDRPELLEHMVSAGRELLKDYGEVGQGRLVFHVPPFNSVDHLHLHVLAGPFNNWYRAIAHRPGMPWAVCAERLLEHAVKSSR